MISREVTCINKREHYNPHERIINIGGTWGKVSQPEAIRQIDAKTHNYYVYVGIYRAEVIVAYHNGNPYLKTTRDSTTVDNLLHLKDCP